MTLEPELGPDFGGLQEWPLQHVVKVLCFYHPDDDSATKAEQEATILRLFHACRRNRLEMLLEIIPSKVAAVTDQTSAEVIQRFYELGVYPDWWKLEPFTSEIAWTAACQAIEQNDPHVRGILVLGLDAREEALAASMQLAAMYPLVKGFAIGRTIFGDAARGWLNGEISDAAALDMMTNSYARLCAIWDNARGAHRTP